MRQLEAETDEQMLALCESLLRAQTALRCRRAFMHDIRNPAQSIQSGLELLERVLTAKTTKVSAEQCITLIRQSLANLQRMVEKTLDSLAPCAASPTAFGARALLEEFTLLLINDAAARSVNFRIDVDPSLMIRATLPRVRQVLLSLLLDSLDVADASGTITVTASAAGDVCVLQIIDARDSIESRAPSATPGITPEPLLNVEQWWQALITLAHAENGVLEREHDGQRYVVRLRLPSGGTATPS